jgi:hypothetical protein
MPNTTTWNITYPDSSSNLTPLESHFQEIAVDTDNALTSLKSNIRGTDTTNTIKTLSDGVSAINTRLALNLQTSTAAPSGAPINSGQEGSMHWDSTNDTLYVYTNSAWKAVWRDTGWVNITVNATFAAHTSPPQYRIIGNTVHLRGAFAITGIQAAPSTNAVGQLPSPIAYPSDTVVYAGMGVAHTNITRMTISNTGAITLSTGTVQGSGGYFINHTYTLG